MYKVSVNRRLLLERRIQEDKNALVRALKNNDVDGAKKALTGMSGDDIGMDSKDFRTLFNLIGHASDPKSNDAIKDAALDDARRLMGVGKNTPQSTQTHNPVTGQPWTSGPATALTPQEAGEVYTTIMHTDPADFRLYPHLKSAAAKIKANKFDSLSNEEHDNFVNFYLDFLNDRHVSQEDKDWFADIVSKLMPDEG